MKILTDTQIREADRYTIENEPISSIALMERASNVIAEWICNNIDRYTPLTFLIGKGNNGGDGLAVARILYHAGYNCSIFIPFDEEQLTEECLFNLKRLPIAIKRIDISDIQEEAILIDALLGTGVKGEIKEPLKDIINKINSLTNQVVSIDLPSGIKAEFGNNRQQIIKADTTLTLQYPKLAMLLPEAGEYCGNIKILKIGISDVFLANTET